MNRPSKQNRQSKRRLSDQVEEVCKRMLAALEQAKKNGRKIAPVLLLCLFGCGRPCDSKYDFERSYYERHVSDLETERAVRGVTNDSGPSKWGYALVEWWKNR